MKTRIFTLCSTVFVISLLLAACSSTASLPSAASSSGLSQAAELALGTLKLEGASQALTSQQASQLLVLWQAYQSLSNSDSIAQAELDGLVDQIQENMTAEQTQAIADMQLNSQSQAEIIQSLGMEVVSNYSQVASQPAASGQPESGMGPGGDGAGIPLDGAAMPSDDQAVPQASSQASARTSNRLQQVNPLLINAVIEVLEAQSQKVSS